MSAITFNLKLATRSILPLVQARALNNRSKPASVRVRAMADQKLNKETPDSVWKSLLSAQEYQILRQKGTEPAGSGTYNKFSEPGEYKCAGCGTVLYEDTHKFDSGCGWPAFWDNKPGTVDRHEDNAFGMKRVEITCANCGGHLGHVFEGERFGNPKDERHCVNSQSIKHEPKA